MEESSIEDETGNDMEKEYQMQQTNQARACR
jgi:hypothetical protein